MSEEKEIFLYQNEEESLYKNSKIKEDITQVGIFENFMVIISYFFSIILFPFTSYIIKEYERALYFRNGRCMGSVGPGLVVLLPFVDSLRKIDLRTLSLDVTKQEVITKDSVTIQVDAVVFYRVFDQMKSVNNVENFFFSTGK
jgi:regulator of protease activity HflC (stomatin/prohibitin superfamily)